jgi:alkylated DNA repair dioxygenase AlkB
MKRYLFSPAAASTKQQPTDERCVDLTDEAPAPKRSKIDQSELEERVVISDEDNGNEGCVVSHYKNFLTCGPPEQRLDARQIVQHLEEDLKYETENPNGFTALRTKHAQGDPGTSYSYSKTETRSSIGGWTEPVLSIKRKIEALGEQVHLTKTGWLSVPNCPGLNYVLINRYPEAKSGMGFHADSKRGIFLRPSDGGMYIASVSFGATRRFVLKRLEKAPSGPKVTKKKIELLLEPGDLLIMDGRTQDYWAHSVSHGRVAAAEQGVRFNLTFRMMLSSDEKTQNRKEEDL